MTVFRYALSLTLVVVFLTASAFGAEKRFVLPTEGSPSTGPADAPLTIIEFLDYQ